MPSGSGDQLVVDELGDGIVEMTSYRLHGKRSSLSLLCLLLLPSVTSSR